jgi:hypothetical protein
VDTTEDLFVRFDAMADDTTAAVRANRRKRVNCALETIEGVTFSAHDHFKSLVIFVFANFACRHTQSFAREEVRGGVYLATEVKLNVSACTTGSLINTSLQRGAFCRDH